MASYPLDMPPCRIVQSELVPVYAQARAMAGGGVPQAVEIAPTLWRFKGSVEVLDRITGGLWESFLLLLRGALKTFKLVPPGRKWPARYPRGFAGLTISAVQWDGTGNLSAIGAGRDTVTINQIPNGLILSPGDFFSIPVGGKQHLHRIVEGATASSNSATVTVEPTIRPNAETAVDVRLEAPYCEMVLDADWSAPRNGNQQSFSFSAIQVLF